MITYTTKTVLREEPVYLPLTEECTECCKPLCGLHTVDGRFFPAQVIGEDRICMICTADEGEELVLSPVFGNLQNVVCQKDEVNLTLIVSGKQIAGYCWDTALNKPYFGPLTDDEGIPFTRLDFTAKEHPHHRSIFVAIGDVNGVDLWNEPANCGIIRTQEITDIIGGSACGGFTASNLWSTHEGDPLLREKTTYTVYNQSQACRVLDMTITLTAEFGKVDFGPTKEAGPLGVRMRDELRADNGSGVITNAAGGHGEEECWGKEATWCDYAGEIPEGHMAITIFDHPENERYPATWHVRAYGLFAANNFYFKGGFSLAEGESVTYRYRILLRRETASAEELESRYQTYIRN